MGCLVVALALVLSSPDSARAHNLPEQRRAILSMAPTRVELLVFLELPAGVDASELRDAVDLNGDGRVEGSLEELARAQLLLPRLSEGLSVTVDGEPLRLDLERVEFADGAGEGHRRGFQGMGLFAADLILSPDEVHRVALHVAEEVIPVQAEIQVLDGLEIAASALPAAADAPVVGPAEVLPDLPMVVEVRSPSAR